MEPPWSAGAVSRRPRSRCAYGSTNPSASSASSTPASSTENPDFGGESDLRTGVGVGVRYFTPIGAIRADLATPVDRRDEDSIFGLYIGIGQAF